MISTHISRASAVTLLVAGTALLFASDVILLRLVPAFPESAAWLGQLVGAGWLAVGFLNWLSRPHLIGGIYNRSIVLTNAVIYFVSATVLVKNAPGESPALLILAVPFVFFASTYGWLLFRGPFERDLEGYRQAS